MVPPTSPLLSDISAFLASDPVVPPWWPEEEQERQRLLAAQGRALHLCEMPWGTAGPRALTYFVTKNMLLPALAPRESFYPIHWRNAGIVFEPDADVRQYFTPGTVAVHLWNTMIGHLKAGPIHPASFVAEMCRAQNIPLDG